MAENEDAWELWLEVATQWRSAGFSILGLDYPCLYQEAARLGIELTTRTMRKIKALEQCVLELINQPSPQAGEGRARPVTDTGVRGINDRTDGHGGGQPGKGA